MIFRLPDPPNFSSLSPDDATAMRRWMSEINRQLTTLLGTPQAANREPFWQVSVSVYPSRTLSSSSTLGEAIDAVGTLVKDLKDKGIVA